MKRHCVKFNNEVRKFRSLGDLKTARWFQAMRLLVQSNTKTSHWRNCWMDDDDLDELYEDVVDSSHGWHLWKFGKLPNTINSCKGISYKDEHPVDKFIRGSYQNVNGQGLVIYIYIIIYIYILDIQVMSLAAAATTTTTTTTKITTTKMTTSLILCRGRFST